LRWRRANDYVGVDRDRVGFQKGVSAMRSENIRNVGGNMDRVGFQKSVSAMRLENIRRNVDVDRDRVGF
jgi:hypothetical protein